MKRTPTIDFILAREAKKALAQIENNQYVEDIRAKGVTHLIKIGLAFCGKKFGLASVQDRPKSASTSH